MGFRSRGKKSLGPAQASVDDRHVKHTQEIWISPAPKG